MLNQDSRVKECQHEMKGNTGKILFADLSKCSLTEEHLPEDVYASFLGGYGLGVKFIYDHMKPGVDPLGPGNILGFTTGVLVGTPAMSGNRFTACAKSPLTGTWGDSNCGGILDRPFGGPASMQCL